MPPETETTPVVPPAPAGDGSSATEGVTAVTLTQEQLTAKLTREADSARRAERAKLAEELGVKDMGALKDLLATLQAAEDAKLDEGDRKIKDAEAREVKALEREAKANALVRTAAVTLGLVQAGVTDPAAQAEVAVLVERKLATAAGEDPTAEEVQEAVAKVKETLPALFAAPAEGDGTVKVPAPPSGETTASTPPKPHGSQLTAEERGAQRARMKQGRPLTGAATSA